MKKIISIILAVLCVIGIGGIALYTNSINKDYYNDGYVNGNTAGNLYNSGLFCEYEGIVYFANPNDGNQLYQMNADGTGIKKLSDDSAAFINVDENYVYYTRTGDNSESDFSFLHVNTHSLCKLRRDGKGEIKVLDTAPCMYASLVGNYIYYIHYNSTEASTLYRIKNDGEEKEQIFPQPYFTCSTAKQYIYYNGLENDHNVCMFTELIFFPFLNCLSNGVNFQLNSRRCSQLKHVTHHLVCRRTIVDYDNFVCTAFGNPIDCNLSVNQSMIYAN